MKLVRFEVIARPMALRPPSTRSFYLHYLLAMSGCIFRDFVDQIQGILICLPARECALANQVIAYLQEEQDQGKTTQAGSVFIQDRPPAGIRNAL